MSELRQRREPIRSRKYLDGARGESCKLRFPGCRDDRETTVACHIHDHASFGMGQKADDISIIDGCGQCHAYLDLHSHEMSRALLLEYIVRGLQETLRNRVERGIVFVPQDVAKPLHSQPTPARKPKAARKPVGPSPPMPGTRASGIQRRMDGTVTRKSEREAS